MDDGLTSVSGDEVKIYDNSGTGGGDLFYAQNAGNSYIYFTFIGTGLSLDMPYNGGTPLGWHTIAQNLPYGTHIYRAFRPASGTASVWIDGVQIYNAASVPNLWRIQQVSFHQPKMPPIPEDAVVLADYMLMADFVPRTTADTASQLSKGVRICAASRDTFVLGGSTAGLVLPYVDVDSFMKHNMYSDNATGGATITAFGHAFGCHYWQSTNRATDIDVKLDGSTFTYNTANIYDTDGEWNDVADDGSISKGSELSSNLYGIKNQTLGIHTFGDQKPSGSDYNVWNAWEIATPIHTSSHYQSFETPFLHELVGGDRNMEQTNLICSPDGKTWDEVTRDVSYIGNASLHTNTDATFNANATAIKFDEWRGAPGSSGTNFNKDFAIAYDRLICLRDGQYIISWSTLSVASTESILKVNGNIKHKTHGANSQNQTTLNITLYLIRNDYIESYGVFTGGMQYTNFQIDRI